MTISALSFWGFFSWNSKSKPKSKYKYTSWNSNSKAVQEEIVLIQLKSTDLYSKTLDFLDLTTGGDGSKAPVHKNQPDSAQNTLQISHLPQACL